MKIFQIVLISLIYMSCKKSHETTNVQPDAFVKIDNVVFNEKSSSDLKTHFLNIDTLNVVPYTLKGYGFLTGKIRNINFRTTRSKGLPVIEVSGWDDFGYTYIAKDTSGRIMELYRQKFGSTGFLEPLPITVFASKAPVAGNEWNSTSGWENGRNTLYMNLNTRIIGTNSTTTTGIKDCIEMEYSSPDYKDTVFFKPGRGPVEIRSWRAHLYENLQPGYGGYR